MVQTVLAAAMVVDVTYALVTAISQFVMREVLELAQAIMRCWSCW